MVPRAVHIWFGVFGSECLVPSAWHARPGGPCYLKRGSEELYDHKIDPMEWKNLSNASEYASIKARLKALLPGSEQPEAPQNTD